MKFSQISLKHLLALRFMFYSELRDAVVEVLPSLIQQGIRVFILSDVCDVTGIESLSDKIQEASDQPLTLQPKVNITIKSPALYIYTSGTTGNLALTPSARLCFELCSR